MQYSRNPQLQKRVKTHAFPVSNQITITGMGSRIRTKKVRLPKQMIDYLIGRANE